MRRFHDMSNWPALLTAGFFLLGLALAGVAFYLVRGAWQYTQATAGAVGTVTALNSTPGRPGALVRYRTQDGQEFEVALPHWRRRPRYEVGERVDLRYYLADPAGGHVDKLADRWTLAGIFSFLGIAFTLVGGLGWFVFSRPQAWARPAEAPPSKRLKQEEAAKLRKGRLPK